jgi:predicted ATPase
MLVYLSATLASLGYIDQARSSVNEAVSRARRLKNTIWLATTLAYACGVEWVAKAPRQAKRFADEAVAISNEHGYPAWLAWGLTFCGWSSTALGQPEDGVTLLTRGRSMLGAIGAVGSTAVGLMMLTEAYAKLGRPIEGLNCLVEAGQIIETTDERHTESELYRLRGDLLSAAGDRAAAEQNYHEALSIARRQSAKALELRAATSLARLWRDQGKGDDARALLAPIYGWFTEGLDAPILQDAKALLDELA